MKDDNFLSRWSKRKSASKPRPAPLAADAVTAKATPAAEPNPPTADVVPAEAGTQSPLPPVESLTPESDFTPFMRAGVDPGTKREALKVLLNDPRFNVMDGLDVYIDDYSKPDPLPEGWLEKMNQVARLGIFTPPPEDTAGETPGEATGEGAPALAESPQKPAVEQRLEPSAATAPVDTSRAGDHVTKGDESSPRE